MMVFLLWLLLAGSTALFLTVDSLGPCVPANCSAAMSDLPLLCNCDENCTEFAKDCCGPQYSEGRIMCDGEMGRSLVCVDVSSNMTVPACPTGLNRLVLSPGRVVVGKVILSHPEVVELVYDCRGRPLVVCIPPILIHSAPDFFVLGLSSLCILAGVFILLTYSLFRELRSLSGIILMNLSVAIIMRQVFHITPLLGRIESVSEMKVWRVALAFQLYLISSEFVWTMLLLVHLTHSLHLAWRLSKPSHKWRLTLVYVLIGWGFSLVLCVVPIVLSNAVDVLLGYVSIFVPLLLTVVVSSCLITLATIFLCLFSRNRRRLMQSYQGDLVRLWVTLFAVTLPAIALLLELSFIGVIISNRKGLSVVFSSEWFPYVVSILSGAEVFIVCLAFLCTKKVLKLYRNLLTCSSRHSKPTVLIPTERSPNTGRTLFSGTSGSSGKRRPTRGETPTGEGEPGTPTRKEEGEDAERMVEENP